MLNGTVETGMTTKTKSHVAPADQHCVIMWNNSQSCRMLLNWTVGKMIPPFFPPDSGSFSRSPTSSHLQTRHTQPDFTVQTHSRQVFVHQVGSGVFQQSVQEKSLTVAVTTGGAAGSVLYSDERLLLTIIGTNQDQVHNVEYLSNEIKIHQVKHVFFSREKLSLIQKSKWSKTTFIHNEILWKLCKILLRIKVHIYDLMQLFSIRVVKSSQESSCWCRITSALEVPDETIRWKGFRCWHIPVFKLATAAGSLCGFCSSKLTKITKKKRTNLSFFLSFYFLLCLHCEPLGSRQQSKWDKAVQSLLLSGCGTTVEVVSCVFLCHMQNFRWPHYGKMIRDEVLSISVYNCSRVFSDR